MGKKTYCFSYLGEIRGQGRHRACVRGGRISTYTDSKDTTYKSAIVDAFKRQCKDAQPLDCSIRLVIDVYRELPPSTSPKRVMTQPDTLKPDADNIAKAVMDALNGLAWVDDKQVTDLQVTKHDRVRGRASSMTVYIEGKAAY